MKLRKMWRAVGAAIAIGVLVTTLFGTGVLANGNDQRKGNSLSVIANTVTGGTCIENDIYHPGQEIVFRIWVTDLNGNALTGSDVSSVVVTLPEGVILDAHYGQHPPPPAPPLAYFWTVGWTVPDGYRTTGSLPYEVAVTALDGSKGRFNNSNSILILSP